MSPIIDGGAENDAIRLVLASACEGLAIQRAGVWFLEGQRQEIRCRLLIDQANQTETEDLVLTQRDYPAYFEALSRERAIVANDAHTDPSTCEFSAGYLGPLGIGAMLDVPIRHHGQMIGIICCEHTGPARVWAEDDITFASGLGDLVGRALNARIQKETQDALARLNAELELRVAERSAQLKSTQSQLVEAEKMAALGGLVAGVAHEINTPLGVSVTAVSLLRETYSQMATAVASGRLQRSEVVRLLDQQDKAIDLLESNIARAAHLVDSFKQTAVDQCTDLHEAFELGPLLARTLTSLHPLTRKVCDPVVLSVPADVHMHSYAGSLIQVVTNLLTNAVRHAFSSQPTNARLAVEVSRLGDQRVRIDVRDNGVGMDPAIQRRIFEPFFTTKRGQGGSGLGLSIAYNLVTQRLGGQISVDSAPGQGSCFHLTLPLEAPRA
jgi:signal transduction histidine kinase